MAKSGWANQELRRVAKDVQTLPSFVRRSATSVSASSSKQTVQKTRAARAA